jgi:hypothetical protein
MQENVMPAEQVQEISYFNQRCEEIGFRPADHILRVPMHQHMPNLAYVAEYPILVEDTKTGDILIPLYDIKGEPLNYYKDNSGKLQNGRSKPLEIRRYKPGNERTVTDKGKEKKIKYDTPKGAKALPWISPNIIEAYRKKEQIDTIIITEGQIKAIAGWLKGLYIFGINGHTNTKDRDTGQLHSDILETITTCRVKNVVLLYDGDCNMFRSKDLEEEKDLRERPHGFFSSARNTRELLKDYWKHHEFDVYFAHVNSTELEGNPKGLDDLLAAFPEEENKIIKELTSFSKTLNNFFFKTNITAGLSKVLNHLHLNTAEQYYTAHNQAIKETAFVWHGTKYQWDSSKNELKMIIPGASRNYFRVGDHYYEKLFIPNKNGVLEYQYHRRMSSTIKADHGQDFIKHIPKYKAFCAKPDHVNYQEIINNCFNRYKPFEHEPAMDTTDCPETIKFLTHIFADQLEIGLDYIQLLYQQPTQMLPILCLVSRENSTGKSTFVKLLKNIFTGNMAIIGNADLENDFNASWADKLIVACEESFIDKKKTIEKIKALSTGDKIVMNQKGVDQIEIDCFIKFIFNSNNEDNFVIANENDERFWVRRVPKAKEDRTNLLDIMIDEIPTFLNYLNRRNLVHEKKSRMWFHPDILKTDALKKLIEGNKSAAEREIHSFMRNMMLEHGFNRLEYTLKYITKDILRNRWEMAYIERILKEKIKVKTSSTSRRYKYPVLISLPMSNGNGYKEEIIINQGNGKPYTFEAAQFLSKEEIETISLCPEAKHLGQDSEQLDAF